MKFSELKEFIYTEVTLVIGNEYIYPVTVRDTTQYDNYEVIGIRVDTSKYDCLLISLKEPISVNGRIIFEHDYKYKESTSICNECKD